MVVGMTVVLALALAQAQELRAWLDLEFGDSPEVVQEKLVRMTAEGRFQLTDSWLGEWYSNDPTIRSYDVNIAGVDMTLGFEFNDSKLYRLRFDTDGESAAYFDSQIMSDYQTVRQVLVTALGSPTTSRSLDFLDMSAGYIMWADSWKSRGITRKLGMYKTTGYEYGVELWIEWDWMVDFIAQSEERERQGNIQDAAGGF